MKTKFVFTTLSTLIIFFQAACTSSPSETPPSPAASTPISEFPSPEPQGYHDGKLYPVDEAGREPSFVAFRKRLLEAITEKNADFLLGILDSKIINSFGGTGGMEEFQKIWQPQDPSSRVWDVLKSILSQGGTFREVEGQRQFCAPYVYSAWPDEFDAYGHSAITGEDVPMVEKPDLQSQIMARLSYDIVQTSPDGTPSPESAWREITTQSGQSGYVRRKDVQSPLAYRVCFQQRDGTWLMTVLVAGD